MRAIFCKQNDTHTRTLTHIDTHDDTFTHGDIHTNTQCHIQAHRKKCTNTNAHTKIHKPECTHTTNIQERIHTNAHTRTHTMTPLCIIFLFFAFMLHKMYVTHLLKKNAVFRFYITVCFELEIHEENSRKLFNNLF